MGVTTRAKIAGGPWVHAVEVVQDRIVVLAGQELAFEEPMNSLVPHRMVDTTRIISMQRQHDSYHDPRPPEAGP